MFSLINNSPYIFCYIPKPYKLENIQTYIEKIVDLKMEKQMLTIYYMALPCKPGYSHCNCVDKEAFDAPPILATVQIRDANTGRVLNSSQGGYLESKEVSYTVSNGMKIQLYFDVSTASGYAKPGDYRRAHFSYYYTIN